jgi:2-oxoglutarate dehydrogenase E2 component (dihydrolipoamide succinyltransferase)
MAESITEGTLSQFSKNIGDFIEIDEELATIETDKIDVSVNATQAGIVEQLLVAEGDVVTVDQVIAEIQLAERQPKPQAKLENAGLSHAKFDSQQQQQSTQETQSSTVSHTTEEAPFGSPKQWAKEVPNSTKSLPAAQPAEASSSFHGDKPRRAEEKASMINFNFPYLPR